MQQYAKMTQKITGQVQGLYREVLLQFNQIKTPEKHFYALKYSESPQR